MELEEMFLVREWNLRKRVWENPLVGRNPMPYEKACAAARRCAEFRPSGTFAVFGVFDVFTAESEVTHTNFVG